jgi:GT2 family glycosyltransferase
MKKIKILIPVYNDWQSVLKLLENINLHVSTFEDEFSVTIVNDASTEVRPEFSADLGSLKSIKIINMKENRGHARCNAVGLKFIDEK